VLVTLVCAAPGARAQAPASPSEDALTALRYEAPQSCPGRADFIARVRARTRSIEPRADAQPTTPRLRVRIEVLADGIAGSISIETGDGAIAGRKIRAATCAEASDALALIAALALYPDRQLQAPAQPTTRTTDKAQDGATARGETGRTPATEHGGEDPGRTKATEGISTDADAQAASQPNGAQTPAQPTPGRSIDEPERTSERVSDEPDRAAEPSDDERVPAAHRLGLFASGQLSSGVLPALAPGVELSAAHALQLHGWPELALRAGFRIAPDASETLAQGVTTFGWWSGLAALCSGVRNDSGAASLWLCFAGEIGRLSARGTDTLNARDDPRSWAAIGPHAELQWEVLPPLMIRAGAGGFFPLVRDRFLLAGQMVHRPPRLGVRVDLGVGVRIW